MRRIGTLLLPALLALGCQPAAPPTPTARPSAAARANRTPEVKPAIGQVHPVHPSTSQANDVLPERVPVPSN